MTLLPPLKHFSHLLRDTFSGPFPQFSRLLVHVKMGRSCLDVRAQRVWQYDTTVVNAVYSITMLYWLTLEEQQQQQKKRKKEEKNNNCFLFYTRCRVDRLQLTQLSTTNQLPSYRQCVRYWASSRPQHQQQWEVVHTIPQCRTEQLRNSPCIRTV